VHPLVVQRQASFALQAPEEGTKVHETGKETVTVTGTGTWFPFPDAAQGSFCHKCRVRSGCWLTGTESRSFANPISCASLSLSVCVCGGYRSSFSHSSRFHSRGYATSLVVPPPTTSTPLLWTRRLENGEAGNEENSYLFSLATQSGFSARLEELRQRSFAADSNSILLFSLSYRHCQACTCTHALLAHCSCELALQPDARLFEDDMRLLFPERLLYRVTDSSAGAGTPVTSSPSCASLVACNNIQ
jgi:hypothetical protein